MHEESYADRAIHPPWAQVTWLLLGLAVESPWSALSGPFLSFCARMG